MEQPPQPPSAEQSQPGAAAPARTEQERRLLAELSRALSEPLEHHDRLQAFARLLVPALADWCVLDEVRADGRLGRAAHAADTPDRAAMLDALADSFPLGPDAARSGDGAPWAHGSAHLRTLTEAWLARRALDLDQLDLIARLEVRSAVTLPLTACGQVLGALTLGARQPERFCGGHLALVEEVARRAALALDNARLYREVSAARRAEEALRAREALAREQLAREQAAVELRDTVITVAAHDLRSPLTALLGQALILERRLAQEGAGERLQSSARSIVQQGRRLNRMITALLDAARAQHGRLQIELAPLDLTALMRRIVDEMQVSAPEHALRLEAGAEPLRVSGDELRLEQVFHNLIDNAMTYSPAGTPVTVRLSRRGAEACVEVVDQGVGIAAEALPHLFERFYRAPGADSKRSAGLGVGLYVVGEIVGLHGGTVDVASAEGAGSTFTVRLPARGR